MLLEIISNLTLVSILALINSFLLVYFLIPKISLVIQSRNLNDHPDERSSHSKATPSMAGVAFFITLIMTMFFIQYFDKDAIGLNLIAAITLIFVIGLKDDLLVTAPTTKLLMEIVGIIFIIVNAYMEISTFHGFLGIYEVPLIFSYTFIILMMLTIINAFNLIDGVDGLASIIAIIIFSVFSLIFFTTEYYFYFLICLSFIGMLLAYLIYNFSHTKKIFMGDTGSLIVGFCIGFCSLKFLAMETASFSQFTFKPENQLIVLAGILCIPIFDVLRVIGVRLLHRKKLFHADRNHVHHVLIDSGMPHYKVALLLGGVNYFIVIILIYLSTHFNYEIMIAVLIAIFLIFIGVFYTLKLNNDKNGDAFLTSA